jgi:hypothetical protein
MEKLEKACYKPKRVRAKAVKKVVENKPVVAKKPRISRKVRDLAN